LHLTFSFFLSTFYFLLFTSTCYLKPFPQNSVQKLYHLHQNNSNENIRSRIGFYLLPPIRLYRTPTNRDPNPHPNRTYFQRPDCRRPQTGIELRCSGRG